MTICGYHPMMGSGLEEFGRGLVKAVASKAHREGRTLDQQLVVERDEIYMLKSYLAESMPPADHPMQASVRAFSGIVQIAAFMMDSAMVAKATTEEDFGAHVDAQSLSLAAIVEAYENAFESIGADEGSYERFSRAFATCFLKRS